MGVDVTKETTSGDGLRNGVVTVNAEASNPFPDVPCVRGILLHCPGSAEGDNANSDPVWVGSKSVSADYEETGGMIILPGGYLQVPVSDPSKLWVISTAENQKVSWISL